MTHKHAAVTFHKSSVHMLNSAVANNVYFKILVRLVQLKENQNNCKNMYNKKKTNKNQNKQKPKQNNTKCAQFLNYRWFSILNSNKLSCLACHSYRETKRITQ